MTYTTAYAPVQTQAYAPVQSVASYVPEQVKQLKPWTIEQLVFTIINSEIDKFKRAGQIVDAKATRDTYQQYYTGWNREQIMQAAFNLVEIYDHQTRQWRLVQNEQELRTKQKQCSRKFHYWNKQIAR
jgi:hypothetical protein